MNNYQIAALSVGLSILSVTLLLLVYINFFKNIYNAGFINNLNFNVKKWSYIFAIFAMNAGGCCLVYYTSNLKVLFYVILVLKMKDIIGSLMFFFTIMFKNEKQLTDESESNIVAFIPVYKESEEQLLKTVNSVINNKGKHYLLTCIISEGETPYDINKLFDEVLLSNMRPYQTWMGNVIDITVIYGKKNNKDIILMVKESRMGKKDSIIMCNDIFNTQRKNIPGTSSIFGALVRNHIIELFNVTSFDYLFCTDADTLLSDNTMICLSDSIKRRNAIASCGIVNVDRDSTNNFGVKLIGDLQNYQYLYGQYLRRTNEDLVNQVSCLPGCISMFKLNVTETAKALEEFSKLPEEDNFIKSTVQLIGTDRRYTSLLISTNKEARIVLDKRCHAYTVPPSDFSSYVNQRRRWGSNMYFNGLVNIVAPNVNILLRLFNILDYLRLSLVYFRLFNTIFFIYLISSSDTIFSIVRYVPIIVIVLFPSFCFFVYSLFISHLRKNYFLLVLMFFLNKMFTLVSSVVVMTVMLFNIGNFKWSVKSEEVDETGENESGFITA